MLVLYMQPSCYGSLCMCCTYTGNNTSETPKPDGGDDDKAASDEQPRILMVRTENLTTNSFEQTQETKVRHYCHCSYYKL